MATHRYRLLLVSILVVLCTGAPSSAKPPALGSMSATLVPPASEPSIAMGNASLTTRGSATRFTIETMNLPMGVYTVVVGGDAVANMSVIPGLLGTVGLAEFDTQKKSGKPRMRFDPRGKSIEIRDGWTIVLSTTFPGGPVRNDTVNIDYADTVVGDAVGFNPRARGSLKIRVNNSGGWMHFELQRLSSAHHTLTANGVVIAEFGTMSGGFARLQFSTNPSSTDRPLDFNPAGAVYQVRTGDEVELEFTSAPARTGADANPIRSVSATLRPTNFLSTVTGEAALTIRGSYRDLEVHVGNLEPGDYSLRVNGSSRGDIRISISSGITDALLRYSTHSTGAGILPLDFDPRGQSMQLVRGDLVVLSTTFPQ